MSTLPGLVASLPCVYETTTRTRILALLKSPLTPAQLGQALHLPAELVIEALGELAEGGRVVPAGDGRWGVAT